MRYPDKAKSQLNFGANKQLVHKSSQKFVSTAVTISDEIITSGDMDLNKKIIQHPSATFFIRVKGISMQYSGVQPNDVIVVDRSVPPQSQDLVLAIYNGEFLLKTYFHKNEHYELYADTGKPIIPQKDDDFEIWGVVTYVIHQAKL
jgi:SOS-response transcriptional repressor LexA